MTPTVVRLAVVAPPTRSYRRCEHCEGVFVVPSEHLSAADEAAFYNLHDNSSSDSRYRNYLSPVLEMAWKAIATNSEARGAGARALDFGSGPLEPDEESVVCEFFRERGFVADAYDPYFRPAALESAGYDVIVACEVVEHFRDPASEFEKLTALVRGGGLLVIQTEFFPGLEKFDSWYYRRDPTHVVFYAPKTFDVLAARFGFVVSEMQDGKRVVLRKACQGF